MISGTQGDQVAEAQVPEELFSQPGTWEWFWITCDTYTWELLIL